MDWWVGKQVKRLQICLDVWVVRTWTRISAEEAERDRWKRCCEERRNRTCDLVTGYASPAKVRKRSHQRWPSGPELRILGEGWWCSCCIKCNVGIRRGRWVWGDKVLKFEALGHQEEMSAEQWGRMAVPRWSLQIGQLLYLRITDRQTLGSPWRMTCYGKG